MRILITGCRFWVCPALALDVVRRLAARYGRGIVIVHGGATGVDTCFALAAKGLGVAAEGHPVSDDDWAREGKMAGPRRNQRMVDLGAGLCVAVHRTIMLSKGTKDCARRAVEAGIPTYLVDSEPARPRRLRAGDPRLE